MGILLTMGVAQLGAVGQAAGASNELTLVKEGKPACVIVIPGAASSITKDAAAEMRDGLRRISGADVPIKAEKDLSTTERAATLIAVGEGDLARECGVDAKSLKPEGFHIKTIGNRLVLVGRENAYDGESREQGTYYAAIALLENQLGVRWLWPGPLGEVVPKRATITVPEMDVTDAPALKIRVIRDAIVNRNKSKYELSRQWMKMEPERVRQMAQESASWLRRQRIGRSIQMNYGHGFTKWWDAYHETHPDYFAQQLNGKRDHYQTLGGTDRVKICVSNPAVLDQWIQNAQAFFKEHPEIASFSATPNDNAYSGHCLCERCKAWDAKDAPTTVTLVSVDAAGKRASFPYPALTDRYVHFYNLAAERLEKVCPGKLIGGYAYGGWRTPPVHEKVRDNVVMGYVGFNRLPITAMYERDRAEWDAWAKAAPHIFLRPNLLHFGHGYPLFYPNRLGETIRHCAETGMIGVDFDSLMHHWANQGVNYYVLTKLLWNPKADVNKLIDNYCAAGFGKAAPAIKGYFVELGKYTERLGAAVSGEKDGFGEEVLPVHTPELFAALQAPLDKARKLAADDPAILERIAFLEKGLQYLRLHTEVIRQSLQNPGKKASKALEDAAVARQRFYEENKFSFAVGVPDAVYEDSRNRIFHGFNRKQATPAENDADGE